MPIAYLASPESSIVIPPGGSRELLTNHEAATERLRELGAELIVCVRRFNSDITPPSFYNDRIEEPVRYRLRVSGSGETGAITFSSAGNVAFNFPGHTLETPEGLLQTPSDGIMHLTSETDQICYMTQLKVTPLGAQTLYLGGLVLCTNQEQLQSFAAQWFPDTIF